MCGILAISNPECSSDTKLHIYNGLTSLQHRGQDGFGMCCDDRAIHKNGTITNFDLSDFDIFNKNKPYFIGHVRYHTAGTNNNINNVQPIVIKNEIRISLVHNGNIINFEEIKQNNDFYKCHMDIPGLGDSDSCMIAAIFLFKLESLTNNNEENINQINVLQTCIYLMNILEGSFCLCILIENFGMVILRDKNGIRPLIYGKKNNSYLIASESCTITHLDFEIIRNIKPGEIMSFENTKKEPFSYCMKDFSYKPCLFEYIYFSRADSILDNISVYESRIKMGELLGNKIKNNLDINKIDAIVPVPDTSIVFALGVQKILKIPIDYGFIKNRYIKRTFIMENETIIQKNIKKKLHAVKYVFDNKNILIIDDSIVRGNTSKHIVKLAKEYGACNLYFASAAPPVVNSNKYGIFIETPNELIAYNKTNEEIAKEIGVSKVIYNDLNDIIEKLKLINPLINDFEKSMFIHP